MQLATMDFQNKNMTICLRVSLVVLSLCVLNGCTAKYGRLQGSSDVTSFQQLVDPVQAVREVIVGQAVADAQVSVETEVITRNDQDALLVAPRWRRGSSITPSEARGRRARRGRTRPPASTPSR